MADVKVCDRCGARLDKKMFPITLSPYRYVLGAETMEFKLSYDLCKKCMSDLDKFMEGPGEEKATDA